MSTPLSLYSALPRDPEYFIEECGNLSDDDKRTLWLMLTTPNAEHDARTIELNKLGADLLKPHMKEIPEPLPVPMETAWLIECGSPAIFYCADGDWCSNANHAHKFSSEEEAKEKARTMTTIEPVRVCEHGWESGPVFTGGKNAD